MLFIVLHEKCLFVFFIVKYHFIYFIFVFYNFKMYSLSTKQYIPFRMISDFCGRPTAFIGKAHIRQAAYGCAANKP